jgi:release factor glutamine methyltransferase
VEGELSGAHIDDAKTEALFFVADLVGMEPSRLQAQRDRLVDADEWAVLKGWIGRRKAGEPMQYITGVAGFRSLKLKVTNAVLIPRPETELLVDAALEVIASRRARVLDLCTGSGCVAVSIAAETAGATVVATDVSAGALTVARENAVINGVADSVEFMEGDLFGALGDGGEEDDFDVIVTNPPYVAEGDMETLQSEVRDYEPRVALAAGSDGLDAIRLIIEGAPSHLKRGGVFLMEIGFAQAEAVRALFEESGDFEHLEVFKDYCGIERIVKARRK